MTKSRIAVIVSLLLAPAVVVAQLEQSETSDAATAVPEMQAATEPVTTIPEATEAQPAEVVVVQETTTVAIVEPAISYQNGGMSDPVYSQADWAHMQALPAQARYLAQLEQQRATQFASSGGVNTMLSSIPFDADQAGWRPLPAQQAYFDRIERERTAVAQAPIQPASPDQSAQAGSSELAMADTSAIR